jgi:hypothetical protein
MNTFISFISTVLPNGHTSLAGPPGRTCSVDITDSDNYIPVLLLHYCVTVLLLHEEPREILL